MTFLYLLGGLALLIVGGEFLVRGAVKVAEHFGVSPLLIGLTLVGFGTSTPELVTSVSAALIGSPGIAVGNIVGSNIGNILLILGIAVLINPLQVASLALERDGTLVIVTALLMLGLGLAGLPLGRVAGAVFLICLVAYILFAYSQERAAGATGDHGAAYDKAEAYGELHDGPLNPGHVPAKGTGGVLLAVLMTLGGLAVVVLGGKILVDGAVALARAYGISETVIGLTIVAIGTSMPELVATVIAAMRGHSAVALGNIMGSNIYNILGIGGVTGLISPTLIPGEIARFDNLVMVGTSVLLYLVARTGHAITRPEGALLVAGYVAYVWLIWPK